MKKKKTESKKETKKKRQRKREKERLCSGKDEGTYNSRKKKWKRRKIL